MKYDQLLIFDLDDTIFETRSIGQHHVEPILNNFKLGISPFFTAEEIDSIVSDLWKHPFDQVSEKYKLSDDIKYQFSSSVNSLEYDLEIEAFSDFELIRNLAASKVLVTTGFRKLQMAKITALTLEEVFEEIYIDEIGSPDRIHKKGIFQHLIDSREIESQNFIVVGDNPQSELKAGYELGLTTVQVAKFGQPRSSYSNHFIENFEELVGILGGKQTGAKNP